MHVGIYCRISSDRTGEGLGVDRQELDCRALCERNGWTAEVFTDNDVSAFSGRTRPSYERLLEAVRERRIRGIVAWHPDRLHRSPIELESFITLIEQTGCGVTTVQAGEWDLGSATVRGIARVVGAMARMESEHKADRIRRKHAELAERGRPHGGRRPFGYAANQIDPVPAEQLVLREMADRALRGETVGRIAKWLTASGIETPQGRSVWKHQSVKDILVSPRLAGLRVHRGVVVGEAVWQPVVTLEEHARLRSLLTGRSAPPAARTFPLSGIFWCARCDGRMHGGTQRRSEGRARRYNCGECGSNGILADAAEEHIAELIGWATERLELPRDADAIDDVLAIEREIEVLADAVGNGDLSIEFASMAEKRLRERLAIARTKVGPVRHPIETHVHRDLAVHWHTMTTDEQAALVRRYVLRIELEPVTKRENRVDLTRLLVTPVDGIAFLPGGVLVQPLVIADDH
jgi:site-specific DNA recombinase